MSLYYLGLLSDLGISPVTATLTATTKKPVAALVGKLNVSATLTAMTRKPTSSFIAAFRVSTPIVIWMD